MARFHIDRSPLGLGEAPKGLPSFSLGSKDSWRYSER
jgi:hypothetical protein